jgi:hypothetical protein
MEFELVNPRTGGKVPTKFKADNALEAANKAWKALTQDNKLFVNNLPEYALTFLDEKNNLHHFSIKESCDKENKQCEFKITDISDKINSSLTAEQRKTFLEASNTTKSQIDGTIDWRQEEKSNKKGKVRKIRIVSSSSSSDSDDDLIELYDYFADKRRRPVPLWYWWYCPTIYSSYTTRLYTPIFMPTITPYVQLYIPMSSL